MSQLPTDITVLQTVVTDGEDGFPPAEVGGGRRGPAPMRPEEVRGGPVAAAAAARRARTGSPELGWAAGDEEPQELQPCQLGPSLETPAWLVHASRRQWLSMELSPRSPPEMLESDCPSPLELKSAPSKKMWIKLRSLARGASAAREGQVGAAAREVRVAEVARLLGEPLEEEGPENRPRSRAGNAGSLAALPYLRLRHPLSVLGINYQQFLRQYLENYPIAPGRIQELEERRRRFVEACRAREAAFDAEYMRNPQRVDFDILTFTIALTASEVINPLIEELGCDRFINRE
ncbi:PREDICTED: EP300-interacting inhibitor of differentiation 2 [Chinchilla lanigera]|uniref:EP300-interacting inhibitor of differentiation 2 n=1 Tax=Chinchilla lanigera TaxID=34839 RepID=UPI00038ECCBB|nr:PREDICTED: EP300-interacting inhibitor of differentiation 2 [Chinchilla lanigera]